MSEAIKALSPFYDNPEGFQKILNKNPSKQARGYVKQPDKTWKLKQGLSRETMQISYLQKTMDLVWGQSLWRPEVVTKNLKDNSFHNEYAVIVRVHYYHPIFHEWHFVDGQGAGIVHFRANSDRTMIVNKVGNAMEAGWPRSGVFAFKNAVKPLGKIFGRDVGRKQTDIETYTGIQNGREIQDFMIKVMDAQTLNDTNKAFFELPLAIREMPEVENIMRAKQEELHPQELPSPDQLNLKFDE